MGKLGPDTTLEMVLRLNFSRLECSFCSASQTIILIGRSPAGHDFIGARRSRLAGTDVERGDVDRGIEDEEFARPALQGLLHLQRLVATPE